MILWFIAGLVLGAVIIILIATWILEVRDERKDEGLQEKERENERFNLVHRRITDLNAHFSKVVSGHETSIALLTARTSNLVPYTDACIDRHERIFHAPKKTSAKKK